jgi:hypothetical protein
MNPTAASCAYCGAAADLTRDHVPPRVVFPKPRPKDLITVPACRPCNVSAGPDDEYFGAALRVAVLLDPAGPLGGRPLHSGVDLARVHRVVARVVRGLFLRETGRRFDPAAGLDVFCNASLAGLPPAALAHLRDELLDPLATYPAKRVGGVFEYRSWHDPARPFGSVWGLTFFDAVPFLVTTGPGCH